MLDKIGERIARIEQAARKVEEGNQSVFAALGDCEQALKRIARRAEALPAEYERVEIDQSRGPRVEFTGRLLADSEFQTKGRDALSITLEIWETKGGALIAASYAAPIDRNGHENARVTIVEPDEPQAMRFAVMEAFDWELRARSMAKKLGWSLRLDVQ